MKIAIIGTGNVGTALTAAFTTAGHAVIAGSRDPEGDTVSHADAVAAADAVITAIPGQAVVATLEAVGADVLSDKIVLDVSNAFTEQFTLAYPNDSVARQVQEAFPRVRVVKSLSTMNTSVMTDPSAAPGSTVFVSGDDDDAKTIVKGLLSDLGWGEEQILDLGGVASAAAAEGYGLLFLAILTTLQTPTFNIAVVH